MPKNKGSARIRPKRGDYCTLITKLPPKGSKVDEPILLSCHSNTVKPEIGKEPKLEDYEIKPGGDIIPGADARLALRKCSKLYILWRHEVTI